MTAHRRYARSHAAGRTAGHTAGRTALPARLPRLFVRSGLLLLLFLLPFLPPFAPATSTPRVAAAPDGGGFRSERRAVVEQFGGSATAIAQEPGGAWAAVGIGMRVHGLRFDAGGAPRLAGGGTRLGGIVHDLAPLGDGRHVLVAVGAAGVVVADMLAERGADVGPPVVGAAGLPGDPVFGMPMEVRHPGTGVLVSERALHVLVTGDTAVVVTEAHIVTWDVSEPSLPVPLATLPIASSGRPAIAGDVLIVPAVLSSPAGTYGLQLLRIADPRRPVAIGSLTTGHTLDVSVTGPLAVAVGNRGSTLLDVRDPSRARVLVPIAVPGARAVVLPTDAPGAARVAILSSDLSSLDVESVQDLQSILYYESRVTVVELAKPLRPRILTRHTRRAAGPLRNVGMVGDRLLTLEDGPGIVVHSIDRESAAVSTGPSLLAGPAALVRVGETGLRAAVAEQAWSAHGTSVRVLDLATRTSAGRAVDVGNVEAIDISADRLAVLGRNALTAFALHPGGGMQTGRSWTRLGLPRDVALDGRRAYVLDAALGLQVLDVDDVLRPVARGELSMSGFTALARRGDRLLAAAADGLLYIDVQRPENPTAIGVADSTLRDSGGFLFEGESPRRIAWQGDRAFVFQPEQGIQQFRVGERSSPQQESTFDAFFFGAARGDVVGNAMTLVQQEDPFFPSGTNNILWSIDLDDLETFFEQGPIHLETPGEPRDVAGLPDDELLVADGPAGTIWLSADPAPSYEPPPMATAPRSASGPPPDGRTLFLPIVQSQSAAGGRSRTLRVAGTSGGESRAVAIAAGRAWLAEGRRVSPFDLARPKAGALPGIQLPGSVQAVRAKGDWVIAVTQAGSSSAAQAGGPAGYPGPSQGTVAGVPEPAALHVIAAPPGETPRLVGSVPLDGQALDIEIVLGTSPPVAVVALDDTSSAGSIAIVALRVPRVLAEWKGTDQPLRLEAAGRHVHVLFQRSQIGVLGLRDPLNPFVAMSGHEFGRVQLPAATMSLGEGRLYVLVNQSQIAVFDVKPSGATNHIGSFSTNDLPRDVRNSGGFGDIVAGARGRLDVLMHSGTVATVNTNDIVDLEVESTVLPSPEFPFGGSVSRSAIGRRPAARRMAMEDGIVAIATGELGGLVLRVPGEGGERLHSHVPSAGPVAVLDVHDDRLLVVTDRTARVALFDSPGADNLPIPVPLGQISFSPTDADGSNRVAWFTGDRVLVQALSWQRGVTVSPPLFVSQSSPTDRRIVVVDDLAVVTELDGLHVVDISAPQAPAQITRLHLPGRARDIAMSDHTAVLANGPDGLVLVDVENPATPTEIGHLRLPGDADVIVLDGSIAWLGLSRADGTAFPTAGRHGVRLLAVDITDPSAPRIAAEIALPADTVTDLLLDGDRLWVGLGVDGFALVEGATARRPQLSAVQALPGETHDARVRDLAMFRGRLHVALGADGVMVVDVAE